MKAIVTETPDRKLLPDPEVEAHPRRRTYTGEYNAKILAECDSATEPGSIGAILRREGLYSSHLVDWRRRRAENGVAGLAPKKTGRPPKSNAMRAADKELELLKRENSQLQERLRRADIIIDAQKTGFSAGVSADASRDEREQRMNAAMSIAPEVGVQDACAIFGVPRATVYRRRQLRVVATRRRPVRGLSDVERAEVLRVLYSERFVDASPGEVHATLLEEGVYLASESTMYRILRSQRAVRERRSVRRHPSYAPPELTVGSMRGP